MFYCKVAHLVRHITYSKCCALIKQVKLRYNSTQNGKKIVKELYVLCLAHILKIKKQGKKHL